MLFRSGTYGVAHNLGAAYDLAVVNDLTTSQVLDVTITALFTSSFDDGDTGSDWVEPLNWTTDAVPGGADHVEINGFTVTHSGTATNTVQSLTLINSTLSITDGDLVLNDASRLDNLSTINLNPGGTTTAVLTVENSLVVEGVLN